MLYNRFIMQIKGKKLLSFGVDLLRFSFFYSSENLHSEKLFALGIKEIHILHRNGKQIRLTFRQPHL